MNSLTFEQSTVRHLLFHRQLQVVGCWGVNVSFLCGSNSDCYSERRQNWLWCFHRFLNNIAYGHSLSKRWLCRIIDGCRSNWFNMSMFFSHFSFHSNTWHSLPVTVCVCVFSVFGPTMRICLLRWQSKNLPAIYQPRSALLWIRVRLSIIKVQYNLVIRFRFSP